MKKNKEITDSSAKTSKKLTIPIDDISDNEKTIQDLQVNQIELEVQNQELLKNQKELEESRSRYADLFDFAPVGYFVFDTKGVIVNVNLTGCAMLGLERANLVGKPFILRINPQDRDIFFLHPKKVIDTGQSQQCEIRLIKKDGTEIFVHIGSKPIKDLSDNIQCMSSVTDITERKQGEESLRLSEERYRRLVKMVPIPLGIAGRNGQLKYFNDHFIQSLGYTIADAPTLEELWKLACPDEQYRRRVIETWESAVRQAWQTNSHIEPMEYNVTCKDGTIRTVVISGITIEDNIVATFTDITKRKMAMDALAVSEEKYRELAENSNSIIMKEDNNGNITYFNEYAQKFFGYKEQEVLGKKVLGLITPKIESTGRDLEKVLDDINKDPDKFSIHVNENIKRDGRRVWITWSNKSLFDKDGNRIGHTAIGTDITDRKRTGDELKKQQYYLTKAQQIGSIGTWEYHGETGDIIWTDQNYKNFGVPLGTYVNYDLFLSIVHPDDREYVNYQWQAAMSKNKPYDIEHRIIADGKIKWVREKAELQFDQDGKFVKALGFTQDITQFKNIQRQISEYMDKLKSKNEEMEHFFRVLRHDLGNPLLSVQAFSIELARVSRQITKLMEDINNDKSKIQLAQIINDDIPSSVTYIQTAVKQMNAILEGLRQIANIGQLSVNIQTLDINKLVQGTAEGMKHRLADADAALIIDQLPPCLGDANQIQQVFSNLLTNAVKYKDPNKKCQIHISGKIEENQCVYCVEDNGIGMSEDQQEKIFEPFYRAGSVTNIEGEGLGLTIVAKILERLDGSIWVESQQAIGSKFYVALPKP